MSDELQRIHDHVYRDTPPDRSGEIAALEAERDMLRHEVMKLRFENTGLYAKIEYLWAELKDF